MRRNWLWIAVRCVFNRPKYVKVYHPVSSDPQDICVFCGQRKERHG